MRISGSYAIYKGKEYILCSNLQKDDTWEYELISYDSQDLNNGFIKDEKDRYRKKIKLEELKTAYSVSTWCKYKGYEFQVILYLEKDDIYEIVHVSNTEPVPVKELGFRFVERGVHMKKVKREELDSIYEIKSPILGMTDKFE